MSEQKIPDVSFDFLFPEHSKNEGFNKKMRNGSPITSGSQSYSLSSGAGSRSLLQRYKRTCMLLVAFYFSVIL